MRRRGRASLAALLLGALVTAALLQPEAASARFAATGYSQGTLATTTLQAVTLDSCGTSGSNIVVTWHFAASNVPGVTGANVTWAMSSGLLGAIGQALTPGSYSTSGPDGSEYTTSFNTGLIGNLLSISPFHIQAQTNYQQWTQISTNSKTATGVTIAGIAIYSCS
ncbi:MAG TPA: hypothetical protein VGC45_16325 [Gryllotalpicola sp.]